MWWRAPPVGPLRAGGGPGSRAVSFAWLSRRVPGRHVLTAQGVPADAHTAAARTSRHWAAEELAALTSSDIGVGHVVDNDTLALHVSTPGWAPGCRRVATRARSARPGPAWHDNQNRMHTERVRAPDPWCPRTLPPATYTSNGPPSDTDRRGPRPPSGPPPQGPRPPRRNRPRTRTRVGAVVVSEERGVDRGRHHQVELAPVPLPSYMCGFPVSLGAVDEPGQRGG